MGCSGSDKTGHGAGLTQAFFEDGSSFLLVVVQQTAFIDRFIKLPSVTVDPGLPEERFHAEGAGLVRNNRHNQLAEFRITQQLGQQMHVSHGRCQLTIT